MMSKGEISVAFGQLSFVYILCKKGSTLKRNRRSFKAYCVYVWNEFVAQILQIKLIPNTCNKYLN